MANITPHCDTHHRESIHETTPQRWEHKQHPAQSSCPAGRRRGGPSYGGSLVLDALWDPPDLRSARTWLEKAAAAGGTRAMTELGIVLTTRWDPLDLRAAGMRRPPPAGIPTRCTTSSAPYRAHVSPSLPSPVRPPCGSAGAPRPTMPRAPRRCPIAWLHRFDSPQRRRTG
jgi:hypothetical protein